MTRIVKKIKREVVAGQMTGMVVSNRQKPIVDRYKRDSCVKEIIAQQVSDFAIFDDFVAVVRM